MKKIKIVYSLVAVAILMLAMSNQAEAQKKYVNKALVWAEQGVKLDTALGAAKAAEKNEKTAEWPKTYYAKAMVYMAISKSDDESFKALSEDPMIDAFHNFKKALEMPKPGTLKGMIEMQLLTLSNSLVNKAVNAYKEDDFATAYKYFAASLDVRELEFFGGEIDTAIVFNTGFCAYKAELYSEAIPYFSKAKEIEYGEGDPYNFSNLCYLALGDTLKAIDELQQGFEKHPGDQGMVIGLLNYYLLVAQDAGKAFEYINVAKENDPGNAQLYVAQAQLHDKTGEVDKAIEQYKKAIELDPSAFNAYYNLGIIIFNQAVELTDKANGIRDNNEYLKAKEVADNKFKEALPYFEKAHELQPTDTGLMDTLKTLYYRLKMYDKSNEMKAKIEG